MIDTEPPPTRAPFKKATDIFLPPDWQERGFINRFGNTIRTGFAPAKGDSKGTVILTHGYGEFIELYDEVIAEYQNMGFDVWAMDFYGFGKSGRNDPKSPHTPSAEGMKRHVEDLQEFITTVVRPDRSKPLLMNTHSMGGHVGLMYLEKYPEMFDGAVMSAPMFDIFRLGLPLVFRPVIRGIFNIASAIGLRDVPVPSLPHVLMQKIRGVRDCLTGRESGGLREAFNRMVRKQTPEAKVDRPTFGWIATAFNTIASSTTDTALRKIKTPVLIGSAGRESLVDVTAHERVAATLADARLVKLPTAAHGLWFENDGNYNYWAGHVRSFAESVVERFQTARAGRAAPVFAAGTPRVVTQPEPQIWRNPEVFIPQGGPLPGLAAG